MDNADAADVTLDKRTKKKDKVRSAWISFAGRIVAQIVGAIATVALGVMVLHRYTSNDAPPPALRSVPAAAAGQAGGGPIIIFVTPAMLGLRDADERGWSANRSCTSALDAPATSAAHLDTRPFLPR
jgi:hypothetical protein